MDAAPLFCNASQAGQSGAPRMLGEADAIMYLASQGAASLFGIAPLARG